MLEEKTIQTEDDAAFFRAGPMLSMGGARLKHRRTVRGYDATHYFPSFFSVSPCLRASVREMKATTERIAKMWVMVWTVARVQRQQADYPFVTPIDVKGYFDALGLKQHPDKTFLGCTNKGFEFLGHRLSPRGLGVADTTLARFVARCCRLYEQEPGTAVCGPRFENTMRLWLRWLQAGMANQTKTPA